LHTGSLTTLYRSAAKEAKDGDDDTEGGKKKKGGVQIPEHWPWEEAKKLFLKPDVQAADDVEVRQPPHTTTRS
jgi:flap endonuclease-1